MIDIQNLSFSYNGKPFIENLNFSLADGTLTALIGENGSGKSTLLKLLTGNEKLSLFTETPSNEPNAIM